MEAGDHAVRTQGRDVLAGHGATAAELSEQSRRIAGPTAAAGEEVRGRATAPERGTELGYRFDAYPKWLEASGWKDQSRRHRAAWPTLRRLLELERWPGAAIRLTYPQLADYLCVSEDTAKRRLRDLADELDTVKLRPGTGRSPSVVVVEHPIETPLKYDEVPWEAGGLAGAPDGYLANLCGPKRHYAELYGAKLPPEPEASGGEAPKPEPQEEHDTVLAPPEGAVRAPLETRENYAVDTYPPSDAREGEASQKGRREGEKNAQDRESKEIEAGIKAIPPDKVSNEGRLAALALAESVGRYDELARARLAQAAQYLISRGEASVLRATTIRIASARRRGRSEIRDPLAYVARVIQDVRSARELTAEERQLAASVALASGPSSDEDALARDARARRREEEKRERLRGYEWLFDPVPARPRPERPGEGDAPGPEPWEGSPFAGVVPPERWELLATPQVAGAIRRRMADLAAAGDADEYQRAREELLAAPWVGEPFKERVIARCDESIRREELEARLPPIPRHEVRDP